MRTIIGIKGVHKVPGEPSGMLWAYNPFRTDMIIEGSGHIVKLEIDNWRDCTIEDPPRGNEVVTVRMVRTVRFGNPPLFPILMEFHVPLMNFASKPELVYGEDI